jgi:hypothetical protein
VPAEVVVRSSQPKENMLFKRLRGFTALAITRSLLEAHPLPIDTDLAALEAKSFVSRRCSSLFDN